MFNYNKILFCKIPVIFLALSILIIFNRTASGAGQEAKLVKIGVLAKRSPECCQQKWEATAAYLSREIPGYSFDIVPLGYNDIYTAVEREEIDFILTNSSIYVGLELFYGASRIATLQNKRVDGVYTVYGGVIFCKADRKDIKQVNDLKGKTFMAVEKNSFGGWLTVRRELEERGINPFKDFTGLSFGGSHDSVVYAVRDGIVDAGSVRTDVLERMAMEGKINPDDFQVIKREASGEESYTFPFPHSTRLYPEWPFAKTRHTSRVLAEKVAAVLINMPADSPAVKTAKCAGWTIPSNYQPVHDCLKTIGAFPYENYGKVTLQDVVREYLPWLLGSIFVAVLIILVSLYVIRINRKLQKTFMSQKNEISERKKTEKKLAEKESELRLIAESSLDTIFVLTKTGTIIYITPSAKELFGYELNEMIGSSFTKYVPKEELSKYWKALKDVFLNQKIKSFRTYIKNRNGNLISVEINGQLVKKEGKYIGQGTIRNITDRKRIERQNEQLLQSIVSILIGINTDDCITRWNAAAEKAFGIKTADAAGKYFMECGIQWNWADISQAVMESRTENKTVFLSDFKFQSADERQGFLNISVNAYDGDNPAESGYLLLCENVTNRKILESQLMQAQKLESIGQLAAGIAHEINTPTQYVGDNTRFLQDAFSDLDQLIGKYKKLLDAVNTNNSTGELVNDIKSIEEEIDLDYLSSEIPSAISQTLEGVDRVSRIVRAMKDFSHPGVKEKTVIDINNLIESTITVSKNEWKYVAEMDMDFDESLPHIPCLPGEFNQVILNLIINAAHAIADVIGDGAAKKGRITVSTHSDGEWAEVRISDTGAGIPVEAKAKIFDPFFTTKEVGKGTGQGLSIAHSIITQKHGGTIDFKTEIGKGTTFIIRLPVNVKPA